MSVQFLNWHIIIVTLNDCHCVTGSANQRSPSIDSVLDIVHHAKNFPHIFATSRYSAEQSSTRKHKNDSNPFYQGNTIFQPFHNDTKKISWLIYKVTNNRVLYHQIKGYSAKMAVDGNVSTCSSTEETADPRWWKLTIGEPQMQIKGISITLSPQLRNSFQEFTVFVIGKKLKPFIFLYTCNIIENTNHRNQFIAMRCRRITRESSKLYSLQSFLWIYSSNWKKNHWVCR